MRLSRYLVITGGITFLSVEGNRLSRELGK